MRIRRFYQNNRTYEICLRAREGLPFVPCKTINHILKSCLAKSIQNKAVKIDEYVWMPNHLHIILYVIDSYDFIGFYTELMKRITDAYKSLLGLEQLNLWESRPMVAEILDIDKYIERKIYFHSNPSKANLVDKIENYPGLNTWDIFQKGQIVREKIEWTKAKNINKIPLSLDNEQDLENLNLIKSKHSEILELEICPNIGALSFQDNNITNDIIVREVKRFVKINEREYDKERARKGHNTIGSQKLTTQRLDKKHIPKPREPRIYFMTGVRELAADYLSLYRSKLDQLKRYFNQKIEEFYEWPKGLFQPGLIRV